MSSSPTNMPALALIGSFFRVRTLYVYSPSELAVQVRSYVGTYVPRNGQRAWEIPLLPGYLNTNQDTRTFPSCLCSPALMSLARVAYFSPFSSQGTPLLGE